MPKLKQDAIQHCVSKWGKSSASDVIQHPQGRVRGKGAKLSKTHSVQKVVLARSRRD